MIGSYIILVLLITAFIVDGELTVRILTTVSLRIQICYINYRMKWAAWRMYRKLKQLTRKQGLPDPGEFKFVNIWDRET